MLDDLETVFVFKPLCQLCGMYVSISMEHGRHASQTKENRLNNTRNAPQLSSEPQDIMCFLCRQGRTAAVYNIALSFRNRPENDAKEGTFDEAPCARADA